MLPQGKLDRLDLSPTFGEAAQQDGFPYLQRGEVRRRDLTGRGEVNRQQVHRHVRDVEVDSRGVDMQKRYGVWTGATR